MYTTDAIILNSAASREADELVSFYTRDFGKLIIRAKGAKKITTRQGNFLHTPSIMQISFIAGRAGYILSGIKNIGVSVTTSSFLYPNGYITSFLQLCDTLIYEGQKDEGLWHLISRVLHEVSEAAASEIDVQNMVLWKKEKLWLLALLDVFGVKPEFQPEADLTLVENINNKEDKKKFDYYLQDVLQNKFERPIYFFGLQVRNITTR